MITKDSIGSHVIARTMPGEVFGEGEIIGYCDAPQVLIKRADGSTFWWNASMCKVEDVCTCMTYDAGPIIGVRVSSDCPIHSQVGPIP